MIYKYSVPIGIALFCLLVLVGAGAMLSGVVSFESGRTALLSLYFWSCGGMSVYTFLILGLDKWLAVSNANRRDADQTWRVSERSLHLLAFLGGWPGSLVAQALFRHKVAKRGFRVISWSIVAIHVIGVITVAWQFAPAT